MSLHRLRNSDLFIQISALPDLCGVFWFEMRRDAFEVHAHVHEHDIEPIERALGGSAATSTMEIRLSSTRDGTGTFSIARFGRFDYSLTAAAERHGYLTLKVAVYS